MHAPHGLDDPTIAVVQWDYKMGGVATGSLYLSINGKVAWYSNQTRRTCDWHGRWQLVGPDIVLVHFDYDGDVAKARWKWTYLNLKNEQGIDYDTRIIKIENKRYWSERAGTDAVGFL